MSLFAKAKKARENKKGFTLVELIVVIVILAILAAVIAPSMLRWVEKSRNAKVITEGRSGFTAVQALIAEKYEVEDAEIKPETIAAAAITETGLKGSITFSLDNEGKSRIETYSYTKGNRTATYTSASEAWTVTKKQAQP